MTELEERTIAEQIRKLVPHYSMIEFRAAVSSNSYTVEFYATVNGRRMQCFEMIDKGLFTEEEFDSVAKNIANYLRGRPDFQKGQRNTYNVYLN